MVKDEVGELHDQQSVRLSGGADRELAGDASGFHNFCRTPYALMRKPGRRESGCRRAVSMASAKQETIWNFEA